MIEDYEAAERDVKELEGMVNLKAGVISDKSWATYQDACLTAEKCSGKLEDRSQVVFRDLEAWLIQTGAIPQMQRIQSVAVKVSTKAKSVSKATSKAARQKTI